MIWKILNRDVILNQNFRIFHERYEEGQPWVLCDIRGGLKQAPAYICETLKEVKDLAEELIKFDFDELYKKENHDTPRETK